MRTKIDYTILRNYKIQISSYAHFKNVKNFIFIQKPKFTYNLKFKFIIAQKDVLQGHESEFTINFLKYFMTSMKTTFGFHHNVG